MPAPVTAATIPVTLKAQGDFQDAVHDLDIIAAQVTDSAQILTTTAMVSSAGSKFGASCAQWVEDFNDIRQTLSWMAEQLGNTAQQMMANEQHNTDLASGLTAETLPVSFGNQF